MKQGTQIIYIPTHAEDENHLDAEPGFVYSHDKRPRLGAVFCRYWSKYSAYELRTKANSELTPIECLVIKDTRPQWNVDEVIKNLEKERIR